MCERYFNAFQTVRHIQCFWADFFPIFAIADRRSNGIHNAYAMRIAVINNVKAFCISLLICHCSFCDLQFSWHNGYSIIRIFSCSYRDRIVSYILTFDSTQGIGQGLSLNRSVYRRSQFRISGAIYFRLIIRCDRYFSWRYFQCKFSSFNNSIHSSTNLIGHLAYICNRWNCRRPGIFTFNSILERCRLRSCNHRAMGLTIVNTLITLR